MMKKMLGILLIVSAFMLLSINAFAAISIYGLTFEDNAFADQIVEIKGNSWYPSNSQVGTKVLGSTLNGSTYDMEFNPANYIKIRFTDNAVVNGVGTDLVVFEESGYGYAGATGCPVRIGINGVDIAYTPTWIGDQWYTAQVDLSSFGVANNAQISDVTLWSYPYPDADYGIVGALNSGSPVPLPPSVMILAPGLIGLVTLRKRFRS